MAAVTVVEGHSSYERTPFDIRWGAVIAGLMFTYAIGWLLYLLGSALGLSVAGATDLDAVGKGFALSAAVWIIITSILAYFLGSLFASRLSGSVDPGTGMLHGLALWSVATALMVVLGFTGLANIFQAGQAVLKGGVTAAGAGAAGAAKSDATAGSPATSALQAELKTRLSEALSSTAGNVRMTPEEARSAIDKLDAAALARVASQLVAGDTEEAKNTLIINTGLTRDQVDSAMEGLAAEMDQYAEEAKRQADAVAGYSAAALWVIFIGSAVALLVSVIGGRMGTQMFRRRLAKEGYREQYALREGEPGLRK